MTRQQKVQLAVLLGNLVVSVMALCTEEETGELHTQRLREIRATVNGILINIDTNEPPAPHPVVSRTVITTDDY